MQDFLSVLLALAGVIALMIGVMYLMKWLTGRVSCKGGGGLKIVSTLSLGQDKMILAVKAGGRNLLVGTAPGGISLICELSEEDMALLEGKVSGEGTSIGVSGASFSEILRQNIKKTGGEFFRPYPKEDNSEESEKSDE